MQSREGQFDSSVMRS
nr:unnamed protein product [Callosobruchus chinensis]CAH7764640.1 unnamed protein product [Callosobruchus chinensis]